jgi:hypothetical protein
MKTQSLQLLKNLQIWYGHISTVEESVKKLEDRAGDLEAIHIYIDFIHANAFRKKEFYNISKSDRLSKLDEWIFENIVEEKEYRKYLDKYLGLKDSLKYDDVDEYILEKHYRPVAIETLSKKINKFNLNDWTKKRFRYNYERKTNLLLKDGTNFRFDFRNQLESLFILNESDDKYILAIGGSGSSYQRERYTMFTAIFYLLGKEKTIWHHLLMYNCYNEFEYIKSFNRPIVTYDLGSNYSLDEDLKRGIRKNGINIEKIKYILKNKAKLIYML